MLPPFKNFIGSVSAVANIFFFHSTMQRQQQAVPEENVEPARLAAFIAQASAKRAVSARFHSLSW
jgi:hypothetical protein